LADRGARCSVAMFENPFKIDKVMMKLFMSILGEYDGFQNLQTKLDLENESKRLKFEV
jgi:hypothetical protein